jgi:hypothetical protein
MQTLGTHAHARNKNADHVQAHDTLLLAQKATHLINDAFIRVVGLPPTYGSAPKLI